jgi:hypothetical protein
VTEGVLPAASPGHRGGLTDRPIAFHPLLFAAFPVLALFAANVREGVSVADVLPSLAVVLVATGVLLAASAVAFGSLARAAILISGWVVLFFSYGHLWGLVARGANDTSSLLLREDVLLALWALLAVVVVVLAARIGKLLPAATRILNAVGAFLVVVNAASIGWGLVTARASGGDPADALRLRPPGGELRDIYYIIMDRYGRAETIRRRFGYDNGPFLDSLRDRGFLVAEESAANYPKTAHSLAASLNMTYLDDLTRRAGRGSDDWGPVYSMLQRFRVAESLQAIGYRYVHLGSRWEPTRADPGADLNATTGLSEFGQVLYDTTVAAPVARRVGLFTEQLDPRVRERGRLLEQFRLLEEMPEDDRPTFTFAHILLPHEPYLFEADGNPVSEAEEAARSRTRNYVEQLRFANVRLTLVFDRLLAGPEETDPIVILQADEGPHPLRYEYNQISFRWPLATLSELREKLWILNAYYLPGLEDPRIDPDITPVNTFRMVFREYFGADLPPLPDRTYVFVDQRHLYDFVDVTARLEEEEGAAEP